MFCSLCIFTFNILVQYVIDHRINVLVNVLEQNGEAIFDGQLELFQEIWIVESNNLQDKATRNDDEISYGFHI